MGRPTQKPTEGIHGSHAAEIAASIEREIREGRLAPGGGLPTVRALAADLGVSPTTAAAAYRELKQRGLLVTQGRRGTRVSPAPPVPSFLGTTLPDGVADLASGNPDPALLPRFGPHLAAMDPEPQGYVETSNLPELVERARARLRADGLPHGELSIVSGALDGIERVLLAHLRPGDRVAVEDPGWTGLTPLLRAMGLVAEPVALDERGARPDELERALDRGARAFVLTPRAQNPSGAALDAERAAALRAVAERVPDLLVIEDDHAADVAGAPVHTLCDEATPRFAVVRSVSKALGPDLRLAVVTGDAETLARVEGRQLLGSRWVSHVLQELVLRLWKDRSVARQVRHAERTYTERRRALVGALRERGLPAVGLSGLNVWVPVPEETVVAQHLFRHGYAVRAGESYRIASPPALRITSAALPVEEAPRVAERVAEATHGATRAHAV